MINILKVILLSFIEGFTEFLPISSTGHMIIVDRFISLSSKKEFVTSFEVIIQLGAILAVLIYFFEKINPISINKGKIDLDFNKIKFWIKVAISVVPSAIIGLLFDDYISEHFFNIYIVSIMLVFYGILLYFVEVYVKGKQSKYTDLYTLPINVCIIIGFSQVLALIPGTSRSAATIIGALLLGVSRTVSVEFSFFMAIPTMFGAALLKILKIGFNFTFEETYLIALGFIFSFIFAYIFIYYLMEYIKRYDFKIFAYYRIILGLLLLILFGLGVI